MALIHIALVGGDPKPVLVGVRELGAERVVLLGLEGQRDAGNEIVELLAPVGVETTWQGLHGNPLLAAIQAMQALANEHRARRRDLIVNLGAGERMLTCAGLSAAFVAGIEAFDVKDGRVVHMPVLQFSYEEVVSETKLHILQGLDRLGGETTELRKLAEAAGENDAQVSYHIRGGKEGKGLVELGLVTLDRSDGVRIALTPMGELLARGMEG